MRTSNNTKLQSDMTANKCRKTKQGIKMVCGNGEKYSFDSNEAQNCKGKIAKPVPNETNLLSPLLQPATTYYDVAELTEEEVLKIETVNKVCRETFSVSA